VDSSGLFGAAPGQIRTDFSPEKMPFQAGGPKVPQAPQTFVTDIRTFPDQASALEALRKDEVTQALVIEKDYLETGHVRRYTKTAFNFAGDQERPVTRWLTRGLLSGRVDSAFIDRAARPAQAMENYTYDPASGDFKVKDDSRELLDFMVPFILGLLLSLSIVIGGQYMLQGVSEEKESRILESMLCTVTPEELVLGKLIGLGGAGLTLVGSWIAMGALLSGPALLAVKLPITPAIVVLMLSYFLLGYLFYGSLMTGIGAVTNNMREAQQFSFMFTFMNFIPFYLMTTILGHPESPLATGLSMFPPTAPVSMMLRLTAPGYAVPPWQIAVSMALMIGTVALAIHVASKIFRVGLLMYGKTPNLPEIIRWVRQG
jgi:ABC-2 type transport system permease protein